ncbi:hypothetical protein EU537_05455 [Candidatus Thorarchaeota archaeon]|nr:MAG: hypothetical protein EU537_05455 [Candidatus Thorarchaeota archaeon]
MASSQDEKRYIGGLSRWGLMGILAIIGTYSVAVIGPFFTAYDNLFELVIRIFALSGFVSLVIASIFSMYLREIRTHFSRPFMTVHHTFAALGLILATAHPVTFAIYVASLTVFIPDVSSWYAFWSLAGRQAIYVIYIAVLAAFLRQRIRKAWRYFHGLIYLALFFAYVHGLLIGATLANPIMAIFFGFLLVVSLAVFVIKRNK